MLFLGSKGELEPRCGPWSYSNVENEVSERQPLLACGRDFTVIWHLERSERKGQLTRNASDRQVILQQNVV